MGDGVLPEIILSSVGLPVILGTLKPLTIQGTLKSAKKLQSGRFLLTIIEPEAVCCNVKVKIGEKLFINSADVTSLGTFGVSPLMSDDDGDNEDFDTDDDGDNDSDNGEGDDMANDEKDDDDLDSDDDQISVCVDEHLTNGVGMVFAI